MTNFLTRVFNPRYAQTLQESERRRDKLNAYFIEGWRFLSHRDVPVDEVPELHYVTNKDGSLTIQWEGAKYASPRYTITRSSVVCHQFPAEDLSIDWDDDIVLAVEHLHAIATTVVDDVWPFVLNAEERQALRDHIAIHINTELRAAGLDVDVLYVKPVVGVKDLTVDEVAAIKEVAGGKEAYDELMHWAKDRLPQREIEAFDAVVQSASRESISAALRGIMQQRLDAQAVGQGSWINVLYTSSVITTAVL